MTASLAAKFAPHIYFTSDEVCFPITIETFASACTLKSQTDTTMAIQNPSNRQLYDCPAAKSPYLSFTDPNWVDDLQGDVSEAYGYVKATHLGGDHYYFTYFYLLSHTIPYDCCGCCCPLTSHAHQADIKFITVEVENEKITWVYFGAHSELAGQWVERDRVTFIDGHPIAYSCHGDHSFYYAPGVYPRIYGAVYDVCKADQLCKPLLQLVYDKTDSLFNPDTMGWVYFAGAMNDNGGIQAPTQQWFWTNDLPGKTQSNNWFKRLFCCNYF